MISVLLSIIVPVIFLYVIWALEIYAISDARLIAVALGWGVLAFGIAYAVQSSLIDAGIFTFAQVSQGVAPIFEEILKATLLIIWAGQMRLRYAPDGAAYGFAIGAGFALAENLLYLSNNPDGAVARVLSVSLMHAFTVAIVGTALGGSVYLAQRGRLQAVVSALATAMLVHALFNQAVRQFEGVPLLLVGIGIGLGGTAIVAWLIRQALKSEGRAIQNQLGSLVTAGEVAASTNPNQIAEFLAQNRTALGADRTATLQKYVQLQARRGLLHKTLLLNQRPNFRPTLESQLQELELQLDALRRSMGLYTWTWLRSVLPSEESELWTSLDNELQQPILNLIVELNTRHHETDASELKERVALLRTGNLFDELPDDDLEDLALLLRRHEYDVLDTVIEQNQIDERLFFVAQGSLLASTVDERGKETIITSYVRGNNFGELGLIEGHPYPYSVAAVDDAILYSLSRADFLTLIYAKPTVALEMMRQLVGEIRQQTSVIAWVRMTSEV